MGREKWLKALGKGKCPNCGSEKISEGYVANDAESGWGAVWCEDCKRGIWISRVILQNDEVRAKIVPELPSDLQLS